MFRSSREGPTEEKAGGRTSIWLGTALVAAVGLLLGPLALASSAATRPHATTPVQGSYVSVIPARVAGTVSTSVPIAAAATVNVQVTGTTSPVPAGASAAVVNVTAVNPTANGFLTVFPEGLATTPLVSNLNFTIGTNVANLVTVPLSAAGGISIFNSAGTTGVDVDVEGYYTSTPSTNGSGLYNAISPVRALGTLAVGTAIAGGTSQAVTVAGIAGVPANATAVVVNVTAGHSTLPSFLTVYPAGAASVPTASTLNFGAQVKNAAIANRATVTVGNAGQIEVFNHTGTVNVDVDVDGYYSGAGGVGSYFVPLTTPIRVTDTRTGVNGNAIPAATSESFNLATTASGIPATASSVVANVTVIPGNANGFLTVYPGTSTTTVPVASDVNWTPTLLPPATALGVANFTIADTAGTGSVEVYNGPKNGATINLLIDAFGYFGPPTTPVNTVALKATPNQVLNNGTSTSAITATVDGPSGYMLGDSVSVALVGTPAAACGTILPASIVTNAVGVASFTYTSSTTVGFCAITATEAAQGAKGSATVAQVTVVPPSSFYAIGVVASPVSIPANGTSTSTVTATVTGQDLALVPGDEVMFSISPTATCGTFTAVVTGSGTDTIVTGGQEAFVNTGVLTGLLPGAAGLTYTSSATPGTCTVTAQEANQGLSSTTTITQTQVGYGITLAAVPSELVTGGGNQSLLTATVTYNGAPVVSDFVQFAVLAGSPTGTVCGTVPTLAGTPGVPTGNTGIAGAAVISYTPGSASTEGFCPITATEVNTGATVTTYVTQTNPTSTVNKLVLSAVPTTIPADGTTFSTISAGITGASGSAIASDPVMFAFLGDCGTPASGVVEFGATASTGAAATYAYTASHTAGVCTVTATEAYGGATGTTTITQGPVVYTVVVAATPPTITGNGLTTSTITATVTNTYGVLAGTDTVHFAVTTTNGTTCGSLSAPSAVTGGTGVATVTYNSSPFAGFCTITAIEQTTLGSGSTQVDQTSV